MHLSSEVALDLIEARVEIAETEFWMRHLSDCANCQESFKDWAMLRGQLKSSHLENAPQLAIRKAESIFRSSTVAERPKVREVIASLLFDSFKQPVFAGVRGGAASARQMVLRTEGFDVHVKIWGNMPRHKIAGQVLSRMESTFIDGYRLHLLRDGEHVETILADRLGEFEFPEVPEGSLSLEVELPGMTLVGALN
jgi:hypothetical protein